MKLAFSQDELDKMVSVERLVVEPTVAGSGRNDVNFRVNIDGKHIWQYATWIDLLKRCLSERVKTKRPTYRDVTCCDEWLSFANFFEWVNKEVGYKGRPIGMALDKDIIIRGNKVYSPSTCAFVPEVVNGLVSDNKSTRGVLPVGVHLDSFSGKYVAQFGFFGKSKHIGYYTDPNEAFAAYKIAKEAQIKVVASQYKDVIKKEAYDALMRWEILEDA